MVTARSRLILLPIVVCGFCACAQAPRKAAAPDSFETRWLPTPDSLAALSLPPQQVNTFDLGKFLVVETNDVYVRPGYASYLIDSEVILTADGAKRDYLEKFLQAAYPNAMGGPTAFPGTAGVGSPEIETVDAYLSSLKDGDDRSRADWVKSRPGKRYPFPARDYAAERGELLKQLEGRDALILRYVDAKPRKTKSRFGR